MKKYLVYFVSALLIMSTAAALTSCGSEEKKSEPKSSAQTTSATEDKSDDEAAISADDLAFTYNDVKVELDGDADAAVEALGEYQDVSSQLSCHGEGDDKTYTYDGFVLNTYPKDGADRVLEIVIKNEGIPTSKGIEIGASVDDVTEAYGDGYRQVGLYYAYEDGNGKSLQFLVEDDTVKEIDYYYDV